MNLFFEVIRQGDKYLKSWPKQRVLNCLFIDSKITYYTRVSVSIMPAFLAFIVLLTVQFPDYFNWPVTMTFIFFILGLPIQGLYWLGKRSQTLLPQQLLPWYIEIQNKTHGSRNKPSVISQQPSYQDLALLLRNAFKVGGDNFLQKNELI